MAAGGRAGEERDPAPALLEQVPGASQAAVEVVGRDEVVFQRAGQAAEVALDQHDGDPRLAAGAEERLVLPARLVLVPRRQEDHPRDAVLGRAAGLPPQVGRARRLVEVEPVLLDPDPLLPPQRREPRPGERQARLEPRPGRAPLHQGVALPARPPPRPAPRSCPTAPPSGSAPCPAAPGSPATRSPPRRRAPRRPPARSAPSRRSRPATRDSIARAISRYFGSDADDIEPPQRTSFGLRPGTPRHAGRGSESSAATELSPIIVIRNSPAGKLYSTDSRRNPSAFAGCRLPQDRPSRESVAAIFTDNSLACTRERGDNHSG